MAKFEFQLPNNGPIVEIEADSLQAAQDALVQIPGVSGMRSTSPMERLQGGFTQSWGDTAYGIKQLSGGELTKEQQNLVDAPTPQDVPGMVGYALGDMSQLIAPGGPAMKLGQKMIGRWGPAAADVVLNALHGGVKGVSEGESRKVRAAENAVGTMLGRGFVRTLSGVNPTPDAAYMLNQGVRLTPGQAAGKGSVPGMLEQSAEVLPVASAVIKGMRRRAIGDWNQDMLGRVSPDGTPPTQSGRQGIGEISQRYNEAYRELLPDGLSFNADAQFTDEVVDTINRYSSVLDDAQFKRLKGNAEKLWEMAADGRLTGQNIKAEKKKIAKLANQAMNVDYNAGKAFEELTNALKGLTYRGLGPDDARALQALDMQYSGFLPVQEAMGKQGALTEGLFTPTQLISTSAGRGQQARRAAARGRRPMVEDAIAAEGVLGNNIPPMGPGTGEKIGVLAGLMEPGILAAGLAVGGAYPPLRRWMTNAIGRGNIPESLGRYQISSQAGQTRTDR